MLWAVNVRKVKYLNTTQMPRYFFSASALSTTNSIGQENIEHHPDSEISQTNPDPNFPVIPLVEVLFGSSS
jgi:hypothetical protein